MSSPVDQHCMLAVGSSSRQQRVRGGRLRSENQTAHAGKNFFRYWFILLIETFSAVSGLACLLRRQSVLQPDKRQHDPFCTNILLIMSFDRHLQHPSVFMQQYVHDMPHPPRTWPVMPTTSSAIITCSINSLYFIMQT